MLRPSRSHSPHTLGPKASLAFAAILSAVTAPAFSQTVDVRGRILDQDLAPLPGARVRLLSDTTFSTVSDAAGEFRLGIGTSLAGTARARGAVPLAIGQRAGRLFFARPGSGGRAAIPRDGLGQREPGLQAEASAYVRAARATVREPNAGREEDAGPAPFAKASAGIAPLGEALVVSKPGYGDVILSFASRRPGSIGEIALGRLPAPDPGDSGLVLPRRAPILAGSGTAPAFTLYFSNLAQGDSSARTVSVKCPLGETRNDGWRLDPAAASASHPLLRCFPLQVSVRDPQGRLRAWRQTYVTRVDATAATAYPFLMIGDSFTRDGSYLQRMAEILPGLGLLGTRHYADDPAGLNREGRGGWTLAGYVSVMGGPTYSPFQFPVGIAGSAYLGNTAFWKNVITDSAAYDFRGFQKIARGWQDPPAPFQFDTAGFPARPAAGNVVWSAATKDFREWKNGAWTPLAPQPKWELRFAKYLERNAVAFRAGGQASLPRAVGVLLGLNDFRYRIPSAQALTDWGDRMDSLIASIREALPAVPVVILLPTTTGANARTAPDLVDSNRIFRANMQRLDRYVLERWDTAQRERERVFISPAGLAVDPVGGYDTDIIHPNASGYAQLGEALGATVQSLRDLGE